ncbi:MAG: MBL fold metallo-hydrolase [Candidatus Hodarchaeales archaeon]|jgi:L-ascorbate metabolism protein UlaG (beta-lactamase superfamily)
MRNQLKFAILIIVTFSIALMIEIDNSVAQGLDNEKKVIYAEEFHFNDVDIRWIENEGFKLKSNNIVVYIDPINVYWTDSPHFEVADFIIITHNHAPHYSRSDIPLLSDEETILIKFSIVGSTYANDIYSVVPGDRLDFENISFEFVPMYNTNKFRPTGELYHLQNNQSIGVIVDFGTVRIYHAGDTDRIPEMKSILTDIALLPVSGFAWMSAEEAAGAVDDLKISSNLKYAIPMHYGGSYSGSLNDAVEFSELANCSVVILESVSDWYDWNFLWTIISSSANSTSISGSKSSQISSSNISSPITDINTINQLSSLPSVFTFVMFILTRVIIVKKHRKI